MCVWVYYTVSSCTEISSFFYSALNSCLNSSAEASVSETVTLDDAVVPSARRRRVVHKVPLLVPHENTSSRAAVRVTALTILIRSR